MTRKSYQRDLDALRTDVAGMGELVLDRLDRALEATETGDPDLARSVIEGDEEVNDRYLALESDCIDLFALQQPVASDLRFVAASFKILTDLERVGDLSANLAGYTLAATRDRRDAGAPDVDVTAIGEDAREMLADAVAAYRTEDVARCRAVAERDDDLDALCARAGERVVRDLIERDGVDAWDVERVIDDVSRVLLTLRDVERVGDHAVNVAARTLYMVENDPALVY
ncbi:MAG: phosphate signaling complex protein PhoU [Haloferacaceae archaeon]